MSPPRLRETLKLPPIFSRQRFFLRPRPSFDLPLTVERVVARVETLRVCERDWSTPGRVAGKRSVLMRSQPLFEIVGVADVIPRSEERRVGKECRARRGTREYKERRYDE